MYPLPHPALAQLDSRGLSAVLLIVGLLLIAS